jgi:hypothetical protein
MFRHVFSKRSFPIRTFLRDETGSTAPLEFVLLSIPMIILSFCVVQFMLMAQASIVMQHAAYAAARSAIVHKCPPFSLQSANGGLFGVAKAVWGGCTDTAEKKKQWENAARIALIPISASNGKSEARQSGCAHPEALVKLMHDAAGTQRLDETLKAKACYAFEPDNVRVETEWVGLVPGVTFAKTIPPLKATVKFRLPLLTPTRMIFNSGERGDNTFYWQGEAEVVLL